MGCWPIAGMTSTFVNDVDSLATLQAALDAGVDFLDTAFGYGCDGESEKLIAKVIAHRSRRPVLASKGGMAWINGVRHFDARPETIVKQCETSLKRLGVDCIDLYYLHAPDETTPVEVSATAFEQLKQAGKIQAVGVSNLSLEQVREFACVCPIDAVQDYFNMLQQTDRQDIRTWCQENQASFVGYWPLMKGLLAGRLRRNHQFSDMDSRKKYDIYRGEEWQRNQDFVDQLRQISQDQGVSVAQLVIAWTIQVPGVHSVLCGAKRPYQILESANAMRFHLPTPQIRRIEQAIAQRLPTVT